MAGARVLVADDEAPLRRLLKLYLERAGYEVVEAESGHDAISLVRRGTVDVALLDVMLPGLDGFEVLRLLRRESTIPVIMLTARGEETSRVAGLELGADDYVVKPFSAPEVVARVRAQLRRLSGFGEEGDALFHLDRLEVDATARRCTLDGEPVDLTRREFDLLVAFLSAPNRALSRELLLERVWGSLFVSPKTVDVHVSGLRRKLDGALHLTALRGVGYRLEA